MFPINFSKPCLAKANSGSPTGKTFFIAFKYMFMLAKSFCVGPENLLANAFAPITVPATAPPTTAPPA